MKECRHIEKTIPSMMSIPRLGVTCLVECKECQAIVGNVVWVEVSPLNFEMRFSPESLNDEMKSLDKKQ